MHSSILMAGCFICYWFLLRKETFYRLNRFILAGSIILSISLPSIKIPQQWSLVKNNTIENAFVQLKQTNALGVSEIQANQNTKNLENKPHDSTAKLSILKIATYSYFAGVILFFCAFLVQFLLLLYQKSKLDFIQDGAYKIYELTTNKAPFSFCKWIFLNPALYENNTYSQIIEHEKIHIEQNHFIDMLLAEIGVILFWFNPFMWWLRTAICNNLEFITDKQMLQNGVESESYQMNLLQVSVSQHPLNITTNYNQSILKKRILMMHLKQSSAKSSWKYLAFLPLVLFSIVTLNATHSASSDLPVAIEKSNAENKVHRELISKEFAATSLISIDNITGAISVQGYAGSTIKVEIEKVIIAATDDELQRGIEETKVNISESANGKHLYLDSPYSAFNTDTSEFSYKNNCGDTSCFSYKFQLHYKLKVPFNTNLKLSTINGGDIDVKDVQGDKLIVKHISGSISLEDISGATDAFTISGGIKASYADNPNAQSSYITTSGQIEIAYAEGLNAEVTYEIKDGVLLTEFDAVSLNKKQHKHISKSLKSPLKIGSGSVDLFFKTTSGDVILNKN